MSAAQCKVTDGVNWDALHKYGSLNCYEGVGDLAAAANSATVYFPADAVYIVCAHATRLGSGGMTAADGDLVIGGLTENADGSLSPVAPGQLTIYRTAHADGAIGFTFSMRYR